MTADEISQNPHVDESNFDCHVERRLPLIHEQYNIISRWSHIMDVKCIFLLYIALICAESRGFEKTNLKDEVEHQCYNIYECCKKVGFSCVAFCEPHIVCTNNGTVEELTIIEDNKENIQRASTELFEATTEESLIEASTVQNAISTKVIAVGVCRKGFRLVANGSCKRVLWEYLQKLISAILVIKQTFSSHTNIISSVSEVDIQWTMSVKFLLVLVLATGGLSNDEDCVWNYKCCTFKEDNGKITCDRMCEPEISCDGRNQTDVEVFKDEVEELAPYTLKAKCRNGFYYFNGKCRRVFGRPRDI